MNLAKSTAMGFMLIPTGLKYDIHSKKYSAAVCGVKYPVIFNDRIFYFYLLNVKIVIYFSAQNGAIFAQFLQ